MKKMGVSMFTFIGIINLTMVFNSTNEVNRGFRILIL